MGGRRSPDPVGRSTMRPHLMLAAAPLLRVSNVAMRFGGVVALAGVSFDVGYGQICGLIGPNGSGKTTLFNCISGFYRFSDGDITFEGQRWSGSAAPPHGGPRHRPHLPECRAVPQHERARQHAGRRAPPRPLRLHRQCAAAAESCGGKSASRPRDWHDLLELLDLRDVADVEAGSLPFGTQKRVELARALIGAPKLLMLDEPAGGLNHSEVDELASSAATHPRRTSSSASCWSNIT